MNSPLDRSYRLVGQGAAGLVLDEDGVALGPVELARAEVMANGLRRCKVRSLGDIDHILSTKYGPQPDEVVRRLHRGLHRAAAWIAAGDLGRAGVEAVMLRLSAPARSGKTAPTR